MKKILFAALAAFALVSCQQEQSELNFSDIQGSATIKGKVLYAPGYQVNQSTGLYLTESIPASGIEVVAEVAYSAYDSEAQGAKQYIATTNESGEFEIQVPVGQTAITAQVRPRGFEAEFTGILDVNNKVLSTTAFFEATSVPVSLNSGDLKVLQPITMTASSKKDITSRNLKINIKGEVLAECEKLEMVSYGWDLVRTTKGINSKLLISVTNTTDNNVIYYLNEKTNASGQYAVTLNIYDDWKLADTQVTVSVFSFVENGFEHNFFIRDTNKWSSQMISGIYSQQQSSPSKLLNNGTLVPITIPTIELEFTPTERSEVKGLGLSIDYDENGNRLYDRYNPCGL